MKLTGQTQLLLLVAYNGFLRSMAFPSSAQTSCCGRGQQSSLKELQLKERSASPNPLVPDAGVGLLRIGRTRFAMVTADERLVIRF